MRWHLALAALVGGFVVALLVGCGIDTEDAGTPDPNAPQTTTGGTSTVNEQAAEDLPKRPKGVVAVDGPIEGSLTPQAAGGVSGVRVSYSAQGAVGGFRRLCQGEIDILDTSRQITDAERRLCNRNGVELADPIQVASDAIVIATPNEHDVGGDCLRMSTVDDIFRAGSGITNWNQVGFFNIPLHTTGGDERSPSFQFFAQLALGVPSGATLDDVRSDYIVHRTEDGVRREVTSEARLERVRERYRERINELQEERTIEFQLEVDRAISRARERMLDRFAREDAQRAATEVVLSDFQKALIERRNRRRIDAAIRAAQEQAIARFSFPRLRFLRARYQAALRRERRLGTIGIFRFSYYELYEQRLRPMEIWDPERAAIALDQMRGVDLAGAEEETTTTTTTTATSTSTTTTATTGTATTPALVQQANGDIEVDPAQTPWCVFPSQQTITNGSYPLSRPLLLYVSKVSLEREEVQEFLRSYLDRATELARQNRLVPIPESVQTRNLGIIDLDRTPGVADEEDVETTTVTTETTTGPLPGVGEGATTTTTTTSTTPTTTSTTPTTTTTAP